MPDQWIFEVDDNRRYQFLMSEECQSKHFYVYVSELRGSNNGKWCFFVSFVSKCMVIQADSLWVSFDVLYWNLLIPYLWCLWFVRHRVGLIVWITSPIENSFIFKHIPDCMSCPCQYDYHDYIRLVHHVHMLFSYLYLYLCQIPGWQAFWMCY